MTLEELKSLNQSMRDFVAIAAHDLRSPLSTDGVPPDFVPRLFGRFARAVQVGEGKTPGTGLGLSIVRGLAQANGGEVWYEPNEPSGSCFAVRLPQAV